MEIIDQTDNNVITMSTGPIPIGTVFTGTIGSHSHGVFLKVHNQVIALDLNKDATWTKTDRYNWPYVENYKPVKAMLIISSLEGE